MDAAFDRPAASRIAGGEAAAHSGTENLRRIYSQCFIDETLVLYCSPAPRPELKLITRVHRREGRLRIAAAALLLCSLSASLPAQAHWQCTKWNMTREQVLAAAQGDAHAVKVTRGQQSERLVLGVEGSYAAEGIQFKSRFYFDKAGRLKQVFLKPPYGTCFALEKKLRAVYGRPVKVIDMETITWHDTAKQNRVRLGFFLSPDECDLTYERLRRSRGGGL